MICAASSCILRPETGKIRRCKERQGGWTKTTRGAGTRGLTASDWGGGIIGRLHSKDNIFSGTYICGPSITSPFPLPVEVIDGAARQRSGSVRILPPFYFDLDVTSGGFATVHPNNKLTINAIEAAILKDFSLEAVHASLREAQKVLSGNGPEEDKAKARIEADVYKSLQQMLGTK
ncbi:hypothetical protein EDB83DRAFT_2552464 [Lactarius deliciosus]|nr:hypothetical protein EDB83DRAFT_2552464 [Lactarius deliciosus]